MLWRIKKQKLWYVQETTPELGPLSLSCSGVCLGLYILRPLLMQIHLCSMWTGSGNAQMEVWRTHVTPSTHPLSLKVCKAHYFKDWQSTAYLNISLYKLPIASVAGCKGACGLKRNCMCSCRQFPQLYMPSIFLEQSWLKHWVHFLYTTWQFCKTDTALPLFSMLFIFPNIYNLFC